MSAGAKQLPEAMAEEEDVLYTGSTHVKGPQFAARLETTVPFMAALTSSVTEWQHKNPNTTFTADTPSEQIDCAAKDVAHAVWKTPERKATNFNLLHVTNLAKSVICNALKPEADRLVATQRAVLTDCRASETTKQRMAVPGQTDDSDGDDSAQFSSFKWDRLLEATQTLKVWFFPGQYREVERLIRPDRGIPVSHCSDVAPCPLCISLVHGRLEGEARCVCCIRLHETSTLLVC